MKLRELGWRQGAILDRELESRAWHHAPKRIGPRDGNRLIVVSHDCDILNGSIAKEPVVELIRASVAPDDGGTGRLAASGRNPRALRLPRVTLQGRKMAFHLVVHDRWDIPREHLMQERPIAFLVAKDARLVAEWMAKRYIRSAFPTTFDYLWRRKSKAWRKLLTDYSKWVQGVYLQVEPMEDLPDNTSYACSLLLVVSRGSEHSTKWLNVKNEMERAVAGYWSQFAGIECRDVEILTTDMATFAHIERFQRFDADWVSFEDDTDVVSLDTDFRT